MTYFTLTRRTVLELFGATATGSGLSALDSDATQTTYLLRQGDDCVPVVPLGGDEPAEALYDYRAPFTEPESHTYSSHGTTDLQRENTSILFLYDGPEGLSLVMVHGKLVADERGGPEGDGGGSVSFDITGLPLSGEWVVQDDSYDGESNYDRWSHGGGESQVHWTFDGPRTDGGAFRGLGDELRVRIDPAFNEDAALYGEHYTGRIENWQLLTGDRGNPDRHDLALDEPIELLRGTCTDETVTESPTETPTETPTAEASIDVEILPDVLVPDRPGVVPVVVRIDGGIDAGTVAEADASFGPDGAGPTQVVVRGDESVLFHFRMDQTGIGPDDDSAELVVDLGDRTLTGSGSFRTAGNGGDGEDDADDETETPDDDDDDDDEDGGLFGDGDDEDDEDDDGGLFGGDDDDDGRGPPDDEND